MKSFNGFAVIVFAVLTGIGIVNAQEVQEQIFYIKVDVSGKSASEGEIRPIYSLIVGNPHTNEVLTFKNTNRFGPFAVNGTTYTRFPSNQNLWYTVTWGMPQGLEEEAKFFRELIRFDGDLKRYSFYSEGGPTEPRTVLPPPFDVLTSVNLEIVSYLVSYQDKTMRMGFVEWTTTPSHIDALLRTISAHYRIESLANTPTNKE